MRTRRARSTGGRRLIAPVERDKRALQAALARDIAAWQPSGALGAGDGTYKYKNTVSVVHQGHVIVLAPPQN
jgi:hypothetical protein